METASTSSSSHGPESPAFMVSSPASSATSIHPTFPKKRLIVCCDGTWQDSDGSSRDIPSNVTRLSRCFTRTAGQTTEQIVYYQSGVGTSGSKFERTFNAALGHGIDENIREAYAFLCTNWTPGDEIILIGFSRGAFTARSIAGMVTSLGLLTVPGLNRYAEIFDDMKDFLKEPGLLTKLGLDGCKKAFHHLKHIFGKPQADIPDEGKPSGKDFPGQTRDRVFLDMITEKYRTWLRNNGFTRVEWADSNPGYTGPSPDARITIKAVAVFDTVGSLGIPNMLLLRMLGLHLSTKKRYRFWDTSLSPVVENSFHAMALDEKRTTFVPTIWEQEERPAEYQEEPRPWLTGYNVKQMWFPGVHSDVGGGSENAVGASISNMTLAWMLDQLSSVGCEFDYDTIEFYFSGKKTVTPDNRPLAPQWSCGKMNVANWGIGMSTRIPMQYTASNFAAGKNIERFLWDTNEMIHSSVRLRLQLGGLGRRNCHKWECDALADWQLRSVPMDGTLLDNSTGLSSKAENIKLLETRDLIMPKNQDFKWVDVDDQICRGLVGTKRWVWEYIGPQDLDNHVQVGGFAHTPKYMYEEPLGPFERYLLYVCRGELIFKEADKKTIVQPPRATRVRLRMTTKNWYRGFRSQKERLRTLLGWGSN